MSIKRDAADTAFSKAVRFRDKECLKCGREDTLQCCHIYGRRAKIVRWSFDNAICMCAGCHRYYTENPIAFNNWLMSFLGSGHMELLTEKTRSHLKTTSSLRKEIAKHYKNELKKAEADSSYTMISYN